MRAEWPELESERLRLRQFREEDLDRLAEAYADPQVAHFIGGVQERPDAWRRMAMFMGHWELRGYGFWAVEEKSSGSFAGSVGLWKPEGWPEVEVGYWLCSDMHGRGYATEAVLMSRQHAYEALGMTTLVSNIHPDNKASIAVAERCGAVLEGKGVLPKYGEHLIYRHPGP